MKNWKKFGNLVFCRMFFRIRLLFFLMFDTMEERGAFELEHFILLDIRWCRGGFDFGSLGGKFGNAMEERRFEKISGNHVFVECSFDKEFFWKT